jgi:myo-inositol 2-dehydrogenase / D-chiro-inositol 1-dehydrogenase
VAAAACRGGKKLTFVHRLFSPSVQRLRELIDSGRLGLPWAVHVSWLSAGGLGGGSVERDELVAEPRLSGGGELANFLGYPVGYVRYLTGLEVISVYATTGAHVHLPHRRYGVEDFGVLSLTLQHGIMSTITVGRLPERAASGPGVYSIRVHGSHASVMVDEYRPRVQVWASGGERYGSESAGEQALQGLIADFVSAIDEDRQPLCGPEDGRALAAVLKAAYTSAASGDVVKVEAA